MRTGKTIAEIHIPLTLLLLRICLPELMRLLWYIWDLYLLGWKKGKNILEREIPKKMEGKGDENDLSDMDSAPKPRESGFETQPRDKLQREAVGCVGKNCQPPGIRDTTSGSRKQSFRDLGESHWPTLSPTSNSTQGGTSRGQLCIHVTEAAAHVERRLEQKRGMFPSIR